MGNAERDIAKDLEIPVGKRTPRYRFLEILPGALSYGMIIMLVVLSLISPALGAIYLLIIVMSTLVKAIGVAFRTVQGYKMVEKAEKVNWQGRLMELKYPHENYDRLRGVPPRNDYDFDQHIENLRMMTVEPQSFPNPEKIYHAVIMVAYNEGLDVLIPSVEAVRDTSFPNEKIIFVLGYEERGGPEMEANAHELKKRFAGVFRDFIIVKHPDGLPGEIKGKGPNLTYAGERVAEYVEKHRMSRENIIVTSLDSDNRMSKHYLSYVAYEFVVHRDRQQLSYQPVSLFMNNIWDAPAPMRVIAISNSFFNVITSMRPHALRNFASHSQPLAALIGMDFWSKRTIVEDGHQYWRSLFYFRGKYEVLPIRVPIYQDAVIEETFLKTLKAQFIQLRRWDYGASDVAYVGVRLFPPKHGKKRKEREVPFWNLFPKFIRLLDGHVTLAAMAPIVAFGGWVPKLLNFESRDLVTYNLPNIVSIIQMFASIGLMVTIILSLRMLPARPAKYKKHKSFAMVLQWVLMPVVAIVYQCFTALYSQTRLMLGLYMENFDVTKKFTKSD